MANHASSKKRIRRNARRADINGMRRNSIRTSIKKVEAAISEKNVDAAEQALQKAQPLMHRGVAKGIFHKKTIARKISRLAQHIKSLKAA